MSRLRQWYRDHEILTLWLAGMLVVAYVAWDSWHDDTRLVREVHERNIQICQLAQDSRQGYSIVLIELIEAGNKARADAGQTQAPELMEVNRWALGYLRDFGTTVPRQCKGLEREIQERDLSNVNFRLPN